ncbi:hypothetical protein BJ508DRAFT_12201 [Ascobolus immersus RN42]|uniref:F-box domain-containing protein n=1 Tax=Ascobolus immersus RN42 TaxID=1160509 RepID=A0A3N4HU02_ASCIM|nr:hypothetical protein BJ508DRAFT_12201 [Ascobolus immersus RN42]
MEIFSSAIMDHHLTHSTLDPKEEESGDTKQSLSEESHLKRLKLSLSTLPPELKLQILFCCDVPSLFNLCAADTSLNSVYLTYEASLQKRIQSHCYQPEEIILLDRLRLNATGMSKLSFEYFAVITSWDTNQTGETTLSKMFTEGSGTLLRERRLLFSTRNGIIRAPEAAFLQELDTFLTDVIIILQSKKREKPFESFNRLRTAILNALILATHFHEKYTSRCTSSEQANRLLSKLIRQRSRPRNVINYQGFTTRRRTDYVEFIYDFSYAETLSISSLSHILSMLKPLFSIWDLAECFRFGFSSGFTDCGRLRDYFEDRCYLTTMTTATEGNERMETFKTIHALARVAADYGVWEEGRGKAEELERMVGDFEKRSWTFDWRGRFARKVMFSDGWKLRVTQSEADGGKEPGNRPADPKSDTENKTGHLLRKHGERRFPEKLREPPWEVKQRELYVRNLPHRRGYYVFSADLRGYEENSEPRPVYKPDPDLDCPYWDKRWQ